MEQVQYRNILNEAMLPSAEICFGTDAWIFQQDNDPKHTANATKAWFVDNWDGHSITGAELPLHALVAFAVCLGSLSC